MKNMLDWESFNEGLFNKDYNVTITDFMMGIHVTYHIDKNGIVKKITGQMYDEYPIKIGDKITWEQLNNIIEDNHRLSMKWNKSEVKNILMYGSPKGNTFKDGSEKGNQKFVTTPKPNVEPAPQPKKYKL